MKQVSSRRLSWLSALVFAALVAPGGGGIAHAKKATKVAAKAGSGANSKKAAANKTTKKTTKKPAATKAAPARAAHSALSTSRDTAALANARSSAVTSPERDLEQLLAQQAGTGALRKGTTSVYVVDAMTGEPVVALRPDDSLNPASNVKLVSTATALDALGPDWTYSTQVLGPLPDDGVVRGSIFLRGEDDPTLNAKHIDELAEQLAVRGIQEIDGDVVVGSEPTRDGIYRAAITVRVAGSKAGRTPDITLSTPTPMIVIDNQATTKRSGKSKLSVAIAEFTDETGALRLRLTVTGAVRAGKMSSITKRISHAGAFTAAVLAYKLSEKNIRTTGAVRIADFASYVAANRERFVPVELACHESMKLKDLVAKINKRSINYLADRVVMTAGAAVYGGTPTMSKGVAAMHAWLERQGIDNEDIVLDTGSGLSYQTELSARHIVEVLRAGAGLTQSEATPTTSPGVNEAYVDSLAIGGVDGTLRGRFKGSPARKAVYGKTGTLTKVIALSGLVSHGDRSLAFAIVSNGHVHRQRSSVRKLHEQMVDSMMGYLAQVDSLGAPASDDSQSGVQDVGREDASDDLPDEDPGVETDTEVEIDVAGGG